MKKDRNANIELLRIISMAMIVCHHYAAFGFFAEELCLSRNKLFVDLFGMWGHVGVNIFVLIAGYFMVDSKLRAKKLLSLMGSVWFYSIGLLLLYVLAGRRPELHDIKMAVLPLTTFEYWFISYYVLLMLLSPFLNRLLHALERRAHAALCLLFFALSVLLPTLADVHFADGPLPLFIALYLAGAYCRLYVRPGAAPGRRNLLLALGFMLLCAAVVAGTDLFALRTRNLALLINSTLVMETYTPLAFLAALLLLLAFCSMEPRKNRFISGVGGLTLGVYLLHANPFVSAVIWQKPFRTSSFTGSPLLPLHALAVTASLFAAGCLAEWLRQKFFAPLWDRLIDAVLPGLARVWDACCAWLMRLLDRLTGAEE